MVKGDRLAQPLSTTEEPMESPVDAHREGWSRVARSEPLNVQARKVERMEASSEKVPSD